MGNEERRVRLDEHPVLVRAHPRARRADQVPVRQVRRLTKRMHRTTIGSLAVITLAASIAIAAPVVYVALGSGNRGIDDEGQVG